MPETDTKQLGHGAEAEGRDNEVTMRQNSREYEIGR